MLRVFTPDDDGCSMMFCTNVGKKFYTSRWYSLIEHCWRRWYGREWYWNSWGVQFGNELWMKPWRRFGTFLIYSWWQMSHSRYFNVSTLFWTGCDLLMVYCVITWMSNVCFNLTRLLGMKEVCSGCWFCFSRFRSIRFIFETKHYWLNEFIITSELSYCDQVTLQTFVSQYDSFLCKIFLQAVSWSARCILGDLCVLMLIAWLLVVIFFQIRA